MKKDGFVRTYAEANEVTIKQAKEEVTRVLDHLVEVVATLEDGEKLDLTGILQFEVKGVDARLGRNPQDGSEIQLPATRKVNVRAMKTLKEAVKAQ